MKKSFLVRFNYGIKIFAKRLWGLAKQPVFIVLTVFGNGLITISSLLLYHYEKGINPKINSWLDTLWWAVATVTTVGYGDISPVTTFGKIIGIFMMIIGTALFWSYTALFAGAIMAEEAIELEKKILSIDKDSKESKDRDHTKDKDHKDIKDKDHKEKI